MPPPPAAPTPAAPPAPAVAPPPAAARERAALGRLLLALAIGWCAAFPVVGLALRLQTFADGSLFSYAVAAGDSWAFHWRNISGRAFVWLWAHAPAEAWGRLARDPAGAVVLHGALFFLAPAIGLAATAALDRTPGRALLRWAAASTALALPFVFGFPTELWVAHAAFWPALALVHAPGGPRAAAAPALAALALSHEGGVVWGAVAVGALAATGAPREAFLRGGALLAAALVPWAAMKALVRPDAYVAETLGRNAFNLFDPTSLLAPVAGTLAIALAAFAAALVLARRRGLPEATAIFAGLAAAGLWLALADPPLHAWDRYYFRTLLLGAVPAAGLAAVLAPTPFGARLLSRAPAGLVRALAGAAVVVAGVHAAETARFGLAFARYAAEVRALATGPAADPALGDPAFVSAARLGPVQEVVGWRSTTPFLAALAAPGMAPARLVVDPAPGYFWFDCAAARGNATAPRALPRATRALVATYACLHR